MEEMNIKSLAEALVVYRGDQALVDLFTPSMAFSGEFDLFKYKVEPGLEGRIDLIMQDIYGPDNYLYADIDVILYINNIDNPIGILSGTEILYPRKDNLDSFRWRPNEESNTGYSVDRVASKITYPNKTSTVDPNRKKFLSNNVSVPPTVNRGTRPPVSVEEGKIIIGGI
jgi:hypothetical protein